MVWFPLQIQEKLLKLNFTNEEMLSFVEGCEAEFKYKDNIIPLKSGAQKLNVKFN